VRRADMAGTSTSRKEGGRREKRPGRQLGKPVDLGEGRGLVKLTEARDQRREERDTRDASAECHSTTGWCLVGQPG